MFVNVFYFEMMCFGCQIVDVNDFMPKKMVGTNGIWEGGEGAINVRLLKMRVS